MILVRRFSMRERERELFVMTYERETEREFLDSYIIMNQEMEGGGNETERERRNI